MEAKPIAVKCPHCDGNIDVPVSVSLDAKYQVAITGGSLVPGAFVRDLLARANALDLRDGTNLSAV